MKKTISQFLSLFFFLHAIHLPVYAASVSGNGSSTKTEPYILNTDEQNGKSGSVYFTSHKKDEVLLKGSIWGAVQFPGVHYLPLGTRLLDALSIAGGPLDIADKDELMLSTRTPQGVEVKKVSVYQALSDSAYNPYIQADDIIVVKENRSYQNWNIALQAGTFIISAIALGLLIDDRNKK